MSSSSRPALADPFYYLNNFQIVLDWIERHYSSLLTTAERQFIEDFAQTPRTARALLVRMVMRKGTVFAESKLQYPEIGDTRPALAPLLQRGWASDTAEVSLDALAPVLTKSQLQTLLPTAGLPKSASKMEWTTALAFSFPEPRPLKDWSRLTMPLVTLTIQPWCDRFRLMFFGNLHQDWSTFVLSDLGIYRFESVALSRAVWVFRSRDDIDGFFQLQRCWELFEAESPIAPVLASLPDASNNPWLEQRRGRLLFELAYRCERAGDLTTALELYEQAQHPQARERRIRVLERSEQWGLAYTLAEAASTHPVNEAERQQVERILPRLRRRLNLPALAKTAEPKCEILHLTLPLSANCESVEICVQAALADATSPVFYVENTLFNALFGLLCWEAVFAPVTGAFFHPFQSGPADLHDPDFRARRAAYFERCLGALETGAYYDVIRQCFKEKYGVVSPFVYWDALNEPLLDHALTCIPAAHIQHWCEWLLRDIRQHRAGLPDLIQFWPAERRYRMVEVKGPGDRLQDNQRRWLRYCHQHEIPVAVCYVQWCEPVA